VPSASETAYPRLKSHPSPHELAMVYTPTKDEVALAEGAARSELARLGFLVLLKTFQRLGYFVQLRDVVTAYHTDGEADQRLAAIEAVLAGKSVERLEQCDAHEAHAGHNYYPFLWRFYASHRPTLFRIWRAIPMKTTSQDASLVHALAFILAHEHSRSEWLPLTGEHAATTTLDLSWVPESWWRLVTGQHPRDAPPKRVNRRHLEVCIWTQLMWDLKSGDACIEGSAEFADYRAQLVSWDEYTRMAPAYSEQARYRSRATRSWRSCEPGWTRSRVPPISRSRRTRESVWRTGHPC
jgi:hypothetical protein